jgi:DNA primase
MEEARIRQLLELLSVRKIKASGGNVMATCPFEKFHKSGKDSKPSFGIRVSPSGESGWQCFGCGRKGKTIKSLLIQLDKDLGVRVPGFDVEVKIENEVFQPRRNTRFNHSDVVSEDKVFFLSDWQACFETVPEYVFERGLSKEQVKKFHLGYNPSSLRMFIPIFDMHKAMVGYSQRSLGYDVDSKIKYKFNYGFNKKKYLYGEWLWDKSDPVLFLSEGYFDVYALDRVMRCNSAGFFGTGVGDLQLLKIAKNFKKVVVCPHNDKLANGRRAGVSIATDWYHALSRAGVVVEMFPVFDGYSDVGDWPEDLLRAVCERMGYGDRLKDKIEG